MRRTRRAVSVIKTIGGVGTVMAIAGGLTFAVMQTQHATLRSNTISSATANLLIGDGNDSYGSMMPGYSFGGIEPGGPAAPAAGFPVRLHNGGTTNLRLRLALNTSRLNNQTGADLTKVFIALTPTSGGPTQEFSLAALHESYVAGGVEMGTVLSASDDIGYSMRVRIAADAVGSTSESMLIDQIDLLFSGVTQSS